MKLINYFLPNRCVVCNFDSLSCLCVNCVPKIINLKLDRCDCCFREIQVFENKDTRKVCFRCQETTSLISKYRYLWDYNAVTRDFIHTMKYRPSRSLCRYANLQLKLKIRELFANCDWDAVIAIPISKLTYAHRGFNQCQLLAYQLIKNNLSNKIWHQGYQKPQAKLNYQQRINNVKNIYRYQGNLTNKKILLVDDLITTGATANEVAKTLILAGAKAVDLLTLSSKY